MGDSGRCFRAGPERRPVRVVVKNVSSGRHPPSMSRRVIYFGKAIKATWPFYLRAVACQHGRRTDYGQRELTYDDLRMRAID
jgi:hypothetical protein